MKVHWNLPLKYLFWFRDKTKSIKTKSTQKDALYFFPQKTIQKSTPNNLKRSPSSIARSALSFSTQAWPAGLRGFLYLLGLLWTFIGVVPWKPNWLRKSWQFHPPGWIHKGKKYKAQVIWDLEMVAFCGWDVHIPHSCFVDPRYTSFTSDVGIWGHRRRCFHERNWDHHIEKEATWRYISYVWCWDKESTTLYRSSYYVAYIRFTLSETFSSMIRALFI